MRSDGVWTITLDGEAKDTYQRLLHELRTYVVEVSTPDGETFDAILVDASSYRPVDDEGNRLADVRRVFRPTSVHVY